jgi:hypothetical protein
MEAGAMGRRGRRRWTAEEKRQIVEETTVPGSSVSVVARRYDINANLLFKWKRQDEAGQLGGPPAPAAVPEFVPIGVVGRAGEGGPALLARMPGRDEPTGAEASRGAVSTVSSREPAGRDRDRAARRRPGPGRRLRGCPGPVPGGRRVEAAGMIQVVPGTKVHLARRPVNMRSGFDGLSAKVAAVLALDPFSGHLFLFRSNRGDHLKILYWDGSGLCLYAKRLERGGCSLKRLV